MSGRGRAVELAVLVSCGALLGGAQLVGCGGGAAASQEPSTAAEPPEEEVEELPIAQTVPREAEEEAPPEAPQQEPEQEPEFRPGMSVEEAIAAVPQSAQRVNIEQEALAAPLMRTELYEPCAVRGNQRFTARVAVWKGRAVGVDVSTQPQNDALASCVREQIAEVVWADKVPSLNTVEFSY